jgi:hypothetical protein
MIFDIPARRKIRLRSRSIHRHLSIRESVMNNCDLKRHATRALCPTAIVQRPVAQIPLRLGAAEGLLPYGAVGEINPGCWRPVRN